MRSILVLVICVAVACMAASRADAFGAIALGIPEGGITEGLATGTSWGFPTQNQANQRALAECHGYTGNRAAAQQCKLLDTFRDQCYAIAMDPDPGTTGLGLAIANQIGAAQERAIADCKKTAGDRAQFCKLSESHCDGQ